MQPREFLQELRLRSVFRVGAMYTVAAWVLLQAGELLSGPLVLPVWFQSTLIGLLMIGFPITLILTWIFDVTPEGIVHSTDDSLRELVRLRKRHKIDYAIIGTLVVALTLMFYQRPSDQSREASNEETLAAGVAAKRAGPSIAVLAFVDLSPDGDQAYFADGISEEVLNGLTAVTGLSVASRTSSFAFRGKDRSIPDIADLLQVKYVVEGSVRRAGDQVRVTVQLIDAREDRHIWSDNYDLTFSVSRLFAIQDEITVAIVSELRVALGLKEAVRTSRSAPTEDIGAYELFLQARRIRIFSRDTYRQRQHLLERAVALDPDFAAAWGALAFLSLILPYWDPEVEPGEYLEKARDAAARALLLDPDNAHGHKALGWIAVRDRDWEAAYRHEARAVELDPAQTITALEDLGFLNDALEDINRAIAYRPNNVFAYARRGEVLLSLGQYEDALASLARAILGGDTSQENLLLYAQSHVETGRRAEWAMDYSQYLDSAASDSTSSLWPLLPHIEQLMFSRTSEVQVSVSRFWVAATALGYERDNVLATADVFLLSKLGEFEVLAGRSFTLWLPGLQAFRKSHAFKQKMREDGLVRYWREHGWPDLCRPLGSEDFVCDEMKTYSMPSFPAPNFPPNLPLLAAQIIPVSVKTIDSEVEFLH